MRFSGMLRCVFGQFLCENPLCHLSLIAGFRRKGKSNVYDLYLRASLSQIRGIVT